MIMQASTDYFRISRKAADCKFSFLDYIRSNVDSFVFFINSVSQLKDLTLNDIFTDSKCLFLYVETLIQLDLKTIPVCWHVYLKTLIKLFDSANSANRKLLAYLKGFRNSLLKLSKGVDFSSLQDLKNFIEVCEANKRLAHKAFVLRHICSNSLHHKFLLRDGCSPSLF